MKAVERGFVVDGRGHDSSRLDEMRKLRSDAGVVETGADAVGFDDLAVGSLEELRHRAVKHPVGSRRERRGVRCQTRVLVDLEARTAGLDGVEGDLVVGYEGVERPHRVRAAAGAGDDAVREPTRLFPDLRSSFVADNCLEVPDHLRERVRADDRADHVVGPLDGRRPVAHRLVDRLLQRPAAGLDGVHVGPVHPHAVDVGALAIDVRSTI